MTAPAEPTTWRPLVALTIGDPAGIGPEITAKALADPDTRQGMRPLVVGDAGVLAEVVQGCRLDLEVCPVAGPEEVTGAAGRLELLDLGNAGHVEYGKVSAACGRAAVEYVEAACRLVRDGAAHGLVTGPINKEAAWAGGSQFPGHTELLADLLGVDQDQVVTMFVLDRLRIFFLTRHHALREAIDQITAERVERSLGRVAELLAELGVEQPRVALAALNPHAGENGRLGTEERDLLGPAVERARAAGVDATGPVPADAVFHQARQGRWDGVVSLYHDQGHVAAKTVDFFGTVSCQLGLPVIRTSVDHGTAFDIAGTWQADARGEIAAIRVAAELAPGVLRARGRPLPGEGGPAPGPPPAVDGR
jgi:4-phospho-D-threonate 3-dehydrogenase / 4-phospho-D-erythronate 3-dehydrogenase